MKTRTQWQGVLSTILAASSALAGCTDEASRAGAEGVANEVITDRAASALVERIGIAPGPVKQTEGALATLDTLDGKVEIRRLGEDGFSEAAPGIALYLGDQVRAGDKARATILFADQSVVELAEVSTLAIGSRATTADPASSAAVLFGVARFSVTPRVPGEGPFIVFTSAGIVATKGTVFGVGVAADGDARVGVEEGAVEVAGGAALDRPVTLEADGALELEGAGKLAAPIAWHTDDWGTWRDRAEAELDIDAAATLHGNAMSEIEAELDTTYAAVTNLNAPLAAFEAQAAADAEAKASAKYEARLPDAALAIEASYLAALRLEFLTQAYLSHAALASELYVRHPEIKALAKLEPQVQAAVLWPKRFDLVAHAYLAPLRFQYYLHHPRGRMNAHFVGVTIPDFYAEVTPPNVPSAKLAAQLKFKVFTPPAPQVTASARALWLTEPNAGWQVNARAKAKAPRAEVGFYVRPAQLSAKAILGAEIKSKFKALFSAKSPEARGQLNAKWGLNVSHPIKLSAPDLEAAALARANWTAEAPEVDVDAKAQQGIALRGPKAKLDAAAKAKLDARSQLEAKGKAISAATADAKAQAKGKGKAEANFKLKGPEIKAPQVKVEAKGQAGFKLGN